MPKQQYRFYCKSATYELTPAEASEPSYDLQWNRKLANLLASMEWILSLVAHVCINKHQLTIKLAKLNFYYKPPSVNYGREQDTNELMHLPGKAQQAQTKHAECWKKILGTPEWTKYSQRNLPDQLDASCPCKSKNKSGELNQDAPNDNPTIASRDDVMLWSSQLGACRHSAERILLTRVLPILLSKVKTNRDESNNVGRNTVW